MIKNQHRKKGFTLVELSIVLVIMGLLVMGAMAGKEMIKASELNAIISEMEAYKTAVDSFKTTYEGLPGDLKNATSYWTGGVTANGNGDGMIGNGAVTDDTEPYYAWDQLSLAKMIAGTYSGAGTSAVIGTNVPASKHFSLAGFSLSQISAPFSYTDALSRSFPANYLTFGANHATDNALNGSALSPTDASNIDSKIDDGTPDYGKLLGGLGSSASGTCTSGSAPSITYNFANSGISCVIVLSID